VSYHGPPIDLTFEEFAEAVAMLEQVGFPLERSAEEAWPDFRGWRVNYETVAYRQADRLTAPALTGVGRAPSRRGGGALLPTEGRHGDLSGAGMTCRAGLRGA